jgi:LysM repeat protein
MPSTGPRPVIPSRICPACGTRIADTASRCAVCGMVFESGSGKPARIPARMSGAPASLNVPVGVVIAGPVISIVLGALIMVVVFRLRGFPASTAPPTAVPATPTITLTLAPTDTLAPTQTLTPLPPVRVTVKEGDTCLGLAEQVGIQDISLIKLENGKSPNCDSLSIGQVLIIPQPTPTLPPPPTQTQNAAQSTEAACPFESYTVVEGDSLMGISDYWDVPPEAIKKWNPQYSFINDQVMIGMKLRIPLCERYPTQGPSPTPTTPPPYPAPNLLTPRDGTIFSAAENDIALQWAAVAALRDNEEYQVTIEDISVGEGQKSVLYVKDTRLLVPAELKPTDGTMHIFRWSVMIVRRTGANDAGNPLYITAGVASERRVFGWGGTGFSIPTPTP